MKRTKGLRKVIAVLTVAMVLIVVALPVSAFAAEEDMVIDVEQAVETIVETEETADLSVAETQIPEENATEMTVDAEKVTDIVTETESAETVEAVDTVSEEDAVPEEAVVLDESVTDAEMVVEEVTEEELAEKTEEPVIETGDFVVTTDDETDVYSYADGILYINSGRVTVSGATDTGRISIAGNADVVISDLTINAASGAAITVEPQASAVLTVCGTNNLRGGNGFAAVEISYVSGNEFGSLVIKGDGTLNANGGNGSAGVGGSKSHKGVYGDIRIESGTINANGNSGAAGIGSSDNPANGTSSGSYKYVSDRWGTITINGGHITANGSGNGAGIGGGNHSDSGKIIINGGHINAKGDSGIGSGLGSSKGADKGPGYYYADVTINGGDITAFATNNMGAGIGGGMYGDAYVTITGGDVNASVSTSGKAYQGGAGIGGGYQGSAVVTITGGNVNATGGNGSAGIGNGALAAVSVSNGSKSVRTGCPTIASDEAKVTISGGTVKAEGGVHAAGIGSGNSSEWSRVYISGGTVTAVGGKASESDAFGGAGIGSGASYAPSKSSYYKDTDVTVSITGGNVKACGGWGASGIGSGALNKNAESITISGSAKVEAYADGTKFAVDTRDLQEDGTTASRAGSMNISGDIFQGTFVHSYTGTDGAKVSTEGIDSIIVTDEATGREDTVDGMPEGYRSFAVTTGSGTYSVFVHESESEGRYFGTYPSEVYDGETQVEEAAFEVTAGLSDNYYLVPSGEPVAKRVIEPDVPAETEEPEDKEEADPVEEPEDTDTVSEDETVPEAQEDSVPAEADENTDNENEPEKEDVKVNEKNSDNAGAAAIVNDTNTPATPSGNSGSETAQNTTGSGLALDEKPSTEYQASSSAVSVIEESNVPLSNPASDMEESMVPLAASNAEDGTQAAAGESWALINLICTVLTAVIAIILFANWLSRKKAEKEDDMNEKQSNGFAKLLAFVPAVIAAVAFILTENIFNPMVLTDRWTMLMIVIMAVNVFIAAATVRTNKKEETITA